MRRITTEVCGDADRDASLRRRAETLQAHRDAIRLLGDELGVDVEEALGEAEVPSLDGEDDLLAAVQDAADAHSEAL